MTRGMPAPEAKTGKLSGSAMLKMSPFTGRVNQNQQEDGTTMIAKPWNFSRYFLTIIW